MEQENFVEYCKHCGHKHKTLEDYINMAENLGLRLSVEDLAEIERVIKEQENKCKERN